MADTILVSGYSSAPKGTPMQQIYGHTGVILEIDPQRKLIVAAEATFITDVAKVFFAKLAVGYDLSKGIDPLLKQIQARMLTPSADSLIVACRACFQRYLQAVEPR
jgi:hypothetical protein